MKKILGFMLTFICMVPFFSVFSHAAYNSEIDIDANIVYMINLDNDCNVIYDKNSEKAFNPAAIVKIVTGILTIENCKNINEKVTADSDAVYSVYGTNSTRAGILVGEQISVKDLLYCTLVYNAGDAAAVLASHIAGSQEAFTSMMNAFAEKLGCTSTHFTNPVGYGDEQYTTAKDLAAMFYYCMNNSTFAQIIGTDYYEIEPTNMYGETRYLKTTNGLMNSAIPDYYYRYVKAGKSGVTDDDHCNVVSVASKDGYNYLCVIMDALYGDFDNDSLEENLSFVCAKQLYEWTFSNIKLKIVANTSAYITEVKVRLSKQYDYVSLVPAAEVSALVPSGVNSESVLVEPIEGTVPEYLNAPVKKGDIIGRAAIKYAGQTIAEVDLCAAFDVKGNLLKSVGDMLLRMLKSTVFKIVFCIAVSAGLAFVMLIMRNGRRQRKKNSVRKVKK